MKKFLYSLLCSLFIALCALSFVACGEDDPANYNQDDYFTYGSSYLTGSTKPESRERGCEIIAKSDVKIISITGKIWWDKNYYNEVVQSIYTDSFETAGFVENTTLEKNTPKTFEFKVTPESTKDYSDSEHGKIPSVLKAGEVFNLKLDNHMTSCVVTDLKIEFVPA